MRRDHNQQRMPIGFRSRHDFGTNDARSPGAVFNNEGLGEGVAQSLTNGAHQNIGTTACGIGHHHAHGLGGPSDVLRLR